MFKKHHALNKIVTLLVVVCFLVIGLDARDPIQSTKSQIAKYAKFFSDNGLFTGTILVTRGIAGKQEIFSGAYGMASRELKVKNKMDTVMLIGSNTKQFTALMIMQEVEKGTIDLNGTISDYLPNYRSDTGSMVTIHQLLSMQSGVPNYTTDTDYLEIPGYSPVTVPFYTGNIAWRLSFTVPDFISRWCSGDLQDPNNQIPSLCPNSTYWYSSSNFYILGAILEAINNKHYAALLKERIFDPLQMNQSGYYHNTSVVPGRALGYLVTLNDNAPPSLTKGGYLDMTSAYAAGAIYSTAEDVNRWHSSLYTNQLLSYANIAKMEHKYVETCPNLGDAIGGVGVFYGYGLFVSDATLGASTARLVYHGGTVAENFESFIMRDTTEKYSIIVISNTAADGLNGPPIPTAMCFGILNILYGRSPMDPISAAGFMSPAYMLDLEQRLTPFKLKTE